MLFCFHGSEMSVSDVTTICLMQCDTSLSHRVDCGLWSVGPLLFNNCAKLLDIGRNLNTLSHMPIQSIVLTRVKSLTLRMPIASALKTCDVYGIVLCYKTAHFRVRDPDWNKFVNKIWEKYTYIYIVYIVKVFFISTPEKWEQKQKCCIYVFAQCTFWRPARWN